MEGDVRLDLYNRDGVILCEEASRKYEEWHGVRDIGKKIEKTLEIRLGFSSNESRLDENWENAGN